MKQDLLAKRYYSDNRRFADLINGIVCNGIPVVKQEDLSEMDTETSQGKRRDLVRKAVFGVNFAVLGDYYGAAEPPVRCGESHLSGLTEPPQFVY